MTKGMGYPSYSKNMSKSTDKMRKACGSQYGNGLGKGQETSMSIKAGDGDGEQESPSYQDPNYDRTTLTGRRNTNNRGNL